MTDESQNRRIGDDRLIRLEQGYQGIELRLVELTTEVRLGRGNTEQLIHLQQRTLDRHESLLMGAEGKNGLVAGVNTLKRGEEARTWHLRGLWTAVLAGLSKFLFDAVKP